MILSVVIFYSFLGCAWLLLWGLALLEFREQRMGDRARVAAWLILLSPLWLLVLLVSVTVWCVQGVRDVALGGDAQ